MAAAAAALLAWRAGASTAAPVIINGTAVPPVPTLDSARVSRGEALYARNCAACHGAHLEGAPNWMVPGPDGRYPAPPHDDSGHTWHHPDAVLLDLIANGGADGPPSGMPAFAGRLSEDEIWLVLDFIKSRWGAEEREFQWWVTQQ